MIDSGVESNDENLEQKSAAGLLTRSIFAILLLLEDPGRLGSKSSPNFCSELLRRTPTDERCAISRIIVPTPRIRAKGYVNNSNFMSRSRSNHTPQSTRARREQSIASQSSRGWLSRTSRISRTVRGSSVLSPLRSRSALMRRAGNWSTRRGPRCACCFRV